MRPKQAILWSEENGGDPGKEVLHYLIHGLLHLIGYRDKEEKERQVMQEAEQHWLNLFSTLSIDHLC